MAQRKPETPEQKYQRKLRRRFDSAKQDLAIVVSRAEVALTIYDISRLIDLVSEHISAYTGPDSLPDFHAWLYQRGLRFAHLWATVKNNVTSEEWLLNWLPEFTGSVDDLESISEWVGTTQEKEAKRLEENAALAQWLFSNPVNMKAVRDGVRSIWIRDTTDDLVGSVYEWVLLHGERLLDSPATAPWPGRLYGLAREVIKDWRTERIRERIRDRKTFPETFDEKTCRIGYVDGDCDGGFIDSWSHRVAPLPTADEQGLRG